ncbi:hypothetical protein [Roseimarinus sediminis]|uniref:hypothetical protein n=1 Tax=Roseimarinus sediminis TaxID=1610899 RepID=UPI003D2633A9
MVISTLSILSEEYLEILIDDEDVQFDYLWKTYRNKDFIQGIFLDVLGEYDDLNNKYEFYNTQLKFYIIRYSNSLNFEIPEPLEIIKDWINTAKRYGLRNTKLLELEKNVLTGADKTLFKYFYPESEIRNYFHQWGLCQVTLDEWLSFPNIVICKEINIPKESPTVYYPGVGELMKKLFMEQLERLKKSEIMPRLNVKLLADREKKILNRVFDNTLNKNDKKYLIDNFKLFKDREITQVITDCMLEDIQLENYDIHSSKSYMQYFLLIEYYKLLNGEGTPANAECSFCYKHKENLPQLLKDFFRHLVDLNLISAEKDAFMAVFSGEIPETKIAWNSNLDQLKLMVNYLDKELHLLDNSERKSQLKIIPNVFCKKDGSDFSTKSFNSIRPGSKIDTKLKAACDVLIPPNYKHQNL